MALGGDFISIIMTLKDSQGWFISTAIPISSWYVPPLASSISQILWMSSYLHNVHLLTLVYLHNGQPCYVNIRQWEDNVSWCIFKHGPQPRQGPQWGEDILPHNLRRSLFAVEGWASQRCVKTMPPVSHSVAHRGWEPPQCADCLP